MGRPARVVVVWPVAHVPGVRVVVAVSGGREVVGGSAAGEQAASSKAVAIRAVENSMR
jgi:hypothetical protein